MCRYGPMGDPASRKNEIPGTIWIVEADQWNCHRGAGERISSQISTSACHSRTDMVKTLLKSCLKPSYKAFPNLFCILQGIIGYRLRWKDGYKWVQYCVQIDQFETAWFRNSQSTATCSYTEFKVFSNR